MNVATFVGTWMDDEARKLYENAFDKNMIDETGCRMAARPGRNP